MSLPVALTPGTVIDGHYIIGDLLNSGGFGSVYRGVDTSEGNRPCAIKETYDVTPASRRRALLEASILFTVRSMHLPEVYDALEANGRFYLVMQLVEGQNLLQLLKMRVPGGLVGVQQPYQQAFGPCNEQEVLFWLLPIMDVLQDLHSRNPPIMHRDIKPGNIIVTPQNVTVLVDFGLTKLYDPRTSSQTLGRAVTEGFSPFEQYVGKTSPQSDIYSMAATMYILLTNRLPPASIGRDVHDSLVPARQLNPTISPKMEAILCKALAIHPEQRFASMRDFAQALREPSFTAFEDRTVAVPQPAVPSMLPAGPPVYGLDVMDGPTVPFPVQQQLRLPAFPDPPMQDQTKAASYPVLPGAPGQANPPQVVPVKPKKPLVQRPLPTPTGQGCLWGLLQGVLAALFVLFSRQATDFYLTTFCGFFFYFAAGFFTTRRGGGVFRGAWSGYWTGIYGTVVFWLSLGIGLAVEFVARSQALTKSNPGLDTQTVSQQVFSQILPMWPQIPFLFPQLPLFFSAVAILLLGVVVAWMFGLFGGIIGGIRNASRLADN